VETDYTRQLLAEAGCTLAQGWLTAYPMPAEEFLVWLSCYRPAGAAPADVPAGAGAGRAARLITTPRGVR
jgi:predicted signal transduction protein with EAL and GGDEF domain